MFSKASIKGNYFYKIYPVIMYGIFDSQGPFAQYSVVEQGGDKPQLIWQSCTMGR